MKSKETSYIFQKEKNLLNACSNCGGHVQMVSERTVTYIFGIAVGATPKIDVQLQCERCDSVFEISEKSKLIDAKIKKELAAEQERVAKIDETFKLLSHKESISEDGDKLIRTRYRIEKRNIPKTKNDKLLAIATLLTKIWYIRENGWDLKDFDLSQTMKDFPQFYQEIDEALMKNKVIDIDILDNQIENMLKWIRTSNTNSTLFYVMEEVAKLHSYPTVKNHPTYTPVTEEFLSFLGISQLSRKSTWNSLMFKSN